MNIILGQENAESIQDMYVVLELDTMRFANADQPVTAYCLIEKLSLEEMMQIERFRDLHQNLMKNYFLRNWQYCENALEHLRGKWNGELDSFYDTLSNRLSLLKNQTLDDDWDGFIDRR